MQSFGVAAPMLAWNRPSAQVRPGLLWQVEQSICDTLVTETPPMLTAATKSTAWSMACTSEAAFSTMPTGSICAWQSAQRAVGCGIAVTAPPGVAAKPVNDVWNFPPLNAVTVPFALVWQCQHRELSGMVPAPGLNRASMAGEVWTMPLYSVSTLDVVPVTRLLGTD